MRSLKVTKILSWVLFSLIVSACISPFDAQANTRLKTLESLLTTLPTISGTHLIRQHNNVIRSNVPKCGRVQILQLFGTNSVGLQEIIKQYQLHLDSSDWQVEHIYTESIIFIGSENVSLGISGNTSWPLFLADDVENGKKKFNSLFILSLGGFVNSNVTVKDCT